MSDIPHGRVGRPDLLKALQRYVANIGISGSSLRNQGAPGVVGIARDFLAELDLAQLKDLEPGVEGLTADLGLSEALCVRRSTDEEEDSDRR